eukprot:Sro701_g189790.2  (229) ;mRNA; r:24008-24694
MVWEPLGSIILGVTKENQDVKLSENGQRLIVGSKVAPGFAQVFDFNGRDWEQIGQTLEGDGELEGNLGRRVAMSRDGSIVALAGWKTKSRGSDPQTPQTNAGVVKVFEYHGERGFWQPKGQEVWGDESQDKFGHSIALTSDGSRLIVGAIQQRLFGHGYARVFDFVQETSRWTQRGEDLVGVERKDQFGYDVATASGGNGILVAVSAAKGVVDGTDGGYVQVFNLTDM